MKFLPIQLQGVKPQSGGLTYPEGFYLLEVQDASEVRAWKSGEDESALIKCKIHMGPGYSQEYNGKRFTDSIPIKADWAAARHKELLVACYGSDQAAEQVLAAHGGQYSPEMCNTRFYIAQVGIKNNQNNVIARIPYTNENWQASVGGNGQPQAQGQPQQAQQPIAQPSQYGPIPTGPAPQQAAYPNFQAPQMPQMVQAPQMPQMPAMPGMPQMPTMGQAPAPQPMGGFPTPPPPPGVMAGGK